MLEQGPFLDGPGMPGTKDGHLDTGSPISLVRAHLISSTHLIVRYTDMAIIYQHVCHWPVMKIPLTCNNNTYSVEVLKVDDLPFPILLGRDTPAFGVLVHSTLPRLTAVLHEKEQPGPSGVQPGEPSMEPLMWETDADFLRLQGTDPTLAFVRDNIAIEEGQIQDYRWATQLPRFKKVRGALLWVEAPERGGGIPRRKLVIPEPCQNRVLQ